MNRERTPNMLKEKRTALGLTQKEVAERVGISESAYQRYEYGWITPLVVTALAMAQVLRSTVEELYGD